MTSTVCIYVESIISTEGYEYDSSVYHKVLIKLNPESIHPVPMVALIDVAKAKVYELVKDLYVIDLNVVTRYIKPPMVKDENVVNIDLSQYDNYVQYSLNN